MRATVSFCAPSLSAAVSVSVTAAASAAGIARRRRHPYHIASLRRYTVIVFIAACCRYKIVTGDG